MATELKKENRPVSVDKLYEGDLTPDAIPSWSEYMKMVTSEGGDIEPETVKPLRKRGPPAPQLSEETLEKQKRIKLESDARRREMREMMRKKATTAVPKEGIVVETRNTVVETNQGNDSTKSSAPGLSVANLSTKSTQVKSGDDGACGSESTTNGREVMPNRESEVSLKIQTEKVLLDRSTTENTACERPATEKLMMDRETPGQEMIFTLDTALTGKDSPESVSREKVMRVALVGPERVRQDRVLPERYESDRGLPGKQEPYDKFHTEDRLPSERHTLGKSSAERSPLHRTPNNFYEAQERTQKEQIVSFMSATPPAEIPQDKPVESRQKDDVCATRQPLFQFPSNTSHLGVPKSDDSSPVISQVGISHSNTTISTSSQSVIIPSQTQSTVSQPNPSHTVSSPPNSSLIPHQVGISQTESTTTEKSMHSRVLSPQVSVESRTNSEPSSIRNNEFMHTSLQNVSRSEKKETSSLQDEALSCIRHILVGYERNLLEQFKIHHSRPKVGDAELMKLKSEYDQKLYLMQQQNLELQRAIMAWKAKVQTLEAHNKTLTEKIQHQDQELEGLTNLCDQLITKMEGM
eukprot:TRINITY_DN5929_c0_g1_i7.p1 TRINITY_DN5929_c0_g1~~TRINITY_DN5929_c0_g1_i7.p1  ORF type:complete len:580 (-),score=102.57 TRINITY_DN5929_c0_g1_i7:265-2004(-)